MAEQEPTVDQHLQDAAEMNPSRPPQPETFTAESPADAALHDATEMSTADAEYRQAAQSARGVVDSDPLAESSPTRKRVTGRQIAGGATALVATAAVVAPLVNMAVDAAISQDEHNKEVSRTAYEEQQQNELQQRQDGLIDDENNSIVINVEDKDN